MKPTESFTKKQAGIAIVAIGLLCSDNIAMMLLLVGTGAILLFENKFLVKFPNYSEKKVFAILCVVGFILLLITSKNIYSDVDNVKNEKIISKSNEISKLELETKSLKSKQINEAVNSKTKEKTDTKVIKKTETNLNTTKKAQSKAEKQKFIKSDSIKNGIISEENLKQTKMKVKTPMPAEIFPPVITLGNIKNLQMAGYINYLRQQIGKKWNLASIYGNGYVVAEFSIDKGGSILSPKLVEGSRNQSLDRSVWNAVVSTNNIAPPPAIYNAQKIRLKFEYNNGNFSIY